MQQKSIARSCLDPKTGKMFKKKDLEEALIGLHAMTGGGQNDEVGYGGFEKAMKKVTEYFFFHLAS